MESLRRTLCFLRFVFPLYATFFFTKFKSMPYRLRRSMECCSVAHIFQVLSTTIPAVALIYGAQNDKVCRDLIDSHEREKKSCTLIEQR
ncbi:hypothetical protein HDV64DRAFT_243024 [Trichoderma sp. TUCIM 5745]